MSVPSLQNGYSAFITARVAKRAKVMFSQACITHSGQLRGTTPKVNHNHPPPPPSLSRVRGHPPPPWPGSEVNHLPLTRVRGQPPPPCPGSEVNHPFPQEGKVIDLPSPPPPPPPPPSCASYWNAFLYNVITTFELVVTDIVVNSGTVLNLPFLKYSSSYHICIAHIPVSLA